MSLTNTYSQEKLGQKGQWFTLIEEQSLAADLRSDIMDSPHALGILLSVVTTNGATTPNFTLKLETVDKAGNVIVLWTAAAAITTDVVTTFLIYPGAALGYAGITEDVDGPLPRVWNLFLDHSAGTFDVAVHACYL